MSALWDWDWAGDAGRPAWSCCRNPDKKERVQEQGVGNEWRGANEWHWVESIGFYDQWNVEKERALQMSPKLVVCTT